MTGLAKIDQLITHHEYWTSKNFEIAQWIIWAAIIASFVATICASIKDCPRWILATFAALPALSQTVDKRLDFSARSNWHELYAISLYQLRSEMEGKTDSEIDARLAKLKADMVPKWPSGDKNAIPPVPKSNEGK